MRTISVGPGALTVSEIALGCMRIDKLEAAAVDALLTAASDEGIAFFDHADIYGAGKSEEVFAASAKRLGLKRADTDRPRDHQSAARPRRRAQPGFRPHPTRVVRDLPRGGKRAALGRGIPLSRAP